MTSFSQFSLDLKLDIVIRTFACKDFQTISNFETKILMDFSPNWELFMKLSPVSVALPLKAGQLFG